MAKAVSPYFVPSRCVPTFALGGERKRARAESSPGAETVASSAWHCKRGGGSKKSGLGLGATEERIPIERWGCNLRSPCTAYLHALKEKGVAIGVEMKFGASYKKERKRKRRVRGGGGKKNRQNSPHPAERGVSDNSGVNFI